MAAADADADAVAALDGSGIALGSGSVAPSSNSSISGGNSGKSHGANGEAVVRPADGMAAVRAGEANRLFALGELLGEASLACRSRE